jgi:hypothetical protein
MPIFVCILHGDAKADPVTVEALTAKNALEAGQQAQALAVTHPTATGYEVWHAGRKILWAPLRRSGAPTPMTTD